MNGLRGSMMLSLPASPLSSSSLVIPQTCRHARRDIYAMGKKVVCYLPPIPFHHGPPKDDENGSQNISPQTVNLSTPSYITTYSFLHARDASFRFRRRALE